MEKPKCMHSHGAVGHDQGESGAASEVLLVLKGCLHLCVLSPRCCCLFQATIHDCRLLPSFVQLLGAPCAAHLKSVGEISSANMTQPIKVTNCCMNSLSCWAEVASQNCLGNGEQISDSECAVHHPVL